LILPDLETKRNLALLFVHPLIRQAPEEDFVGSIVGINGCADAARDGKGIAVDTNRLAECAKDASCAAFDNHIYRLVAGQVGGDDDELVAAKTGESVR
jgi:hypothetical protein